jgi:hypothetical protein
MSAFGGEADLKDVATAAVDDGTDSVDDAAIVRAGSLMRSDRRTVVVPYAYSTGLAPDDEAN